MNNNNFIYAVVLTCTLLKTKMQLEKKLKRKKEMKQHKKKHEILAKQYDLNYLLKVI